MREDYHQQTIKRWDRYFHNICEAVASKSPCLSRQIGAILVRDKSIISTGYNGPARGYEHCGQKVEIGSNICPRKVKGYASGTHLNECPAAHAEVNCISNAARIGISVAGSTLYMNCIVPCKDCAITLVNAGIKEVVVDEVVYYHEMSKDIFKSTVGVRRFIL